MAQQRHGKTGRARRIGRQGAGILRPRAPTRDGGAGRRPRRLPGADAQQEKGNAGKFRRTRQTQARREIERARGAGDLDQSSAETPASRGVNADAQHSLGVTAYHQRQSRRINAEFRQPHAI